MCQNQFTLKNLYKKWKLRVINCKLFVKYEQFAKSWEYLTQFSYKILKKLPLTCPYAFLELLAIEIQHKYFKKQN